MVFALRKTSQYRHFLLSSIELKFGSDYAAFKDNVDLYIFKEVNDATY